MLTAFIKVEGDGANYLGGGGVYHEPISEAHRWFRGVAERIKRYGSVLLGPTEGYV